MSMQNRLFAVAALLAGVGTCTPAFAVGEEPVYEQKFWNNPEGGPFTLGPWVLFDGNAIDFTSTPGEADIAIFDFERLPVPRNDVRGETQTNYGLTIDAPVFIAGMQVNDYVAIQNNPQPIHLGSAGLTIGVNAWGGTLYSPGTITSSGPVKIGGPFTQTSGRASLVMFPTARLFADAGVEILPAGLVDAAGVIEGDVENAGTLDLFSSVAATLLIKGDYLQARAGGEGQPFGGVLSAEIVGPSENNDTLYVQGHATLGGTLLARIISGYQPVPGQLDAVILRATSLEGRFDLVFFSPAINSDLRLRVVYPENTPSPERNNASVRVVADLLPPQPNIGDGTDGAANIPAAPARAVTGDFNGDGFVDVAAVITGGLPPPDRGNPEGQLLIVLNKGTNPDGSWRGFADPVATVVGINAADLATADVDADGDLDIAIISKGNEGPPDVRGGEGGGGPPTESAGLRVYLNDGNANFTDFGTAFDVGYDPRGICFGNFVDDPDNAPDIAVTSLDGFEGEGQVVILTNAGAAGDRAWAGIEHTQSAPAGTPNPGQVTPGGLDNPKDIDDIAVAAGTPGTSATINVLINNNTLAQQRGSLFEPPITIAVGEEPRNITLADIDDDGDTDIITSNRADGTVSIVLNRPGITRGSVDFVSQSLPLGDLAGPVAAFDFDGDGDIDIAAVFTVTDKGGDSQLIQILRNDTAPQSGDRAENPLIFSQGPVIDFSANAFYVLPGDVDNDGDFDVIAFTDPDGAPSRQATAFVNALCPTDLDGSGKTDTADLCKFLMLFGHETELGGRGDLIRDGVVNTRDLVRFLTRFGQTCR